MTTPLFEGSAVKYVLEHLKQKYCYKWFDVRPINNGRYTIVIGNLITDNIAIILKRAWFMDFATICKGSSGIGDSINVEDLKFMVSANVKTIYMVYQDKIYSISMLDFLCNSKEWVNKEGKKIRSISIHLYKREN